MKILCAFLILVVSAASAHASGWEASTLRFHPHFDLQHRWMTDIDQDLLIHYEEVVYSANETLKAAATLTKANHLYVKQLSRIICESNNYAPDGCRSPASFYDILRS